MLFVCWLCLVKVDLQFFFLPQRWLTLIGIFKRSTDKKCITISHDRQLSLDGMIISRAILVPCLTNHRVHVNLPCNWAPVRKPVRRQVYDVIIARGSKSCTNQYYWVKNMHLFWRICWGNGTEFLRLPVVRFPIALWPPLITLRCICISSSSASSKYELPDATIN